MSRFRHRCSSRYLYISPFHLEFHSPLPSSSLPVSGAVPRLGRGLSHPTEQTAYVLFMPSESEQRLRPPYYRGCWHGVSRGFFTCYCQYHHRRKSFTTLGPSSLTRHGWIRVSPIVQDSLLLPPVGVWAVSQSQCG